ncbi:MAG TPA: prolyl oligopeptidase family serine peptidase [Candidatus Angelobacter sp.]|nr:prolyl oligopeptidase family serine peptidase [Candidatus Angelobacter sp.]
MSSPFPTALTSASKANRIAWVFNAEGERNIWIADAPNFEGRQVTHYQGDNGQDIFSPRLTPDGKLVVYARGSEVSHEGHVANPTTEVKEPKQQVWVADVESGTPRLLGEMGCDEEDCEDIELSPDGQTAVWVGAKHHLWIAPVAAPSGDKPADKPAAHQLTEIRGTETDPQWSPDGRHIAFTSTRDGHSFIAIVDVNGDGTAQGVHYLAPTADRDFAPRWSPDGRQIVYLKTGGQENHLPLIPVRPQPWSIWLADAATDKAHELWHSGTAISDSLPPFATDSLKFGGAGRIVFCSEQDGRNHLYSISTAGGRPALLTPGDFDVEDVELSPDKASVLYTSNQNDVDRRHIWKVNLAGGTPQPVTTGKTIEWHPLMLADGKTIVCFGSSATSPAMPYRVTASGREMIARSALPADFPSAQLVEPQQVTFRSEDGLEIHGQLFLPKARTGAPGPALIFVHGGPPRQMMLGFHYMYYYHNAYANNEYLASLGYVVLSVNYRLGIMYGRSFREAANASWRGSSEYKDVLAGAKYLQTLAYVDRKRVGIWGGSYGGLLTALALARNSDVFSAGVDFHGVHDWSMFLSEWAPGAAQAPDYKEALKLAFDSSPVASVQQWKSPVLLIHGDDDRNVPFEQTTDLVQRLRKQNVQFEELIFPDEIHDFLLWRSWVSGYRATAEFFNRKFVTGR